MQEVAISSTRHNGYYLSKIFPNFDAAVETHCLPITHFLSSPLLRQHNVSMINFKTLQHYLCSSAWSYLVFHCSHSTLGSLLGQRCCSRAGSGFPSGRAACWLDRLCSCEDQVPCTQCMSCHISHTWVCPPSNTEHRQCTSNFVCFAPDLAVLCCHSLSGLSSLGTMSLNVKIQ